ncbi:c-type cytochrome [Candidatus Rariloculus sp.]|uniref:c-type cytochrome n=1 Tax=Candidatus Rariloculus sp. TaxID=3101265 RepID=UPI003D0D5693
MAALLVSLHSGAQVPEDGLTSRELGISLEAPSSRSALVERGEAVYQYWCNSCHGPEMLKPGTAALAIKYQGALPAALTERTDMVPAFVELMVREGVSMMPFFRPTEVSDADLDALTAYLTNNSGD